MINDGSAGKIRNESYYDGDDDECNIANSLNFVMFIIIVYIIIILMHYQTQWSPIFHTQTPPL